MFEINNDIIFVKGAVNGAIYDFNTTKVYSINNSACDILFRYINNQVKAEDEKYLTILRHNQLISKLFKPHPFMISKNEQIKLDMAWLEITQKCNLRCLHCYEGNIHKSVTNTLTLEQWKKVIDELSMLGINRMIIIGGEPCCYSKLIDILEYASTYQIDITLFTNATCFTENLFKCVIDNNIKVKISIYGHEAKIHDSITGVSGSFEKMTQTISRLIENSVSVSSAVIIMKENQDYVNQICDFVKRIGMKYSKYDVIREVFGGTQNRHLVTRVDVLDSVMFKKPNFKTSKKMFYQNFSRNSCWYGKIAIMENGNVIPCEFEREYIYGNILTQSISNIIHSDKVISKWFMDFSKIEECCDCEYRFCCHDCRPLGRSVCGKIETKNPRCYYDVYNGIWK